MTDKIFQCRMAVRDYECDMQGVVNNSVYQNYLEHARHEFLKHKGLEFADLTRRGIIVVVVRAELDYLQSLRSGYVFGTRRSGACVGQSRRSRRLTCLRTKATLSLPHILLVGASRCR